MARLASISTVPVDLAGVSRCPGLGLLGISRVGRLQEHVPTLPGLEADIQVGSAMAGGGLSLAAVAPGEWLLLGTSTALAGCADQGDGFLVVDLTQGRTIIRLVPEAARSVLAAFSPLNQAQLLAAPGRCAHTLLGDARVFLMSEPDGLLLIGDMAFDSYLSSLLARGLGS